MPLRHLSGQADAVSPTLLVVMGVSGSGKSTVAAAISQRLGIPFIDADDLHPRTNVDKMAAGHPLSDADRLPWLHRVGRALADSRSRGVVVSCSALKRSYRDILRAHVAPARLIFLHLDGSAELIRDRQLARAGHFMPAALLESQFQALEPLDEDEHSLTVDVSRSVDAIVESFVSARD